MGGTTDLWLILKSYATTISFGDVLDIVIIAYLIYRLLTAVRRTSAGGVVKGILVLLGVVWASRILRLNVINYLLMQVIQVGLLLVVVLFQPELRRFLDQFGSQNLRILSGLRPRQEVEETAIELVVAACCDLARTKTGALIVFERRSGLGDYIASGTMLNASLSAELLKNIFFPNSPLHDGAALIRDGRIAAAGCTLPMSHDSSLSRDLGMRHRAGIGVTEHSDALSIIVSEETGTISIAVDSVLHRHLARETFYQMLKNELLGTNENKGKTGGFALLRRGTKEKRHADKK